MMLLRTWRLGLMLGFVLCGGFTNPQGASAQDARAEPAGPRPIGTDLYELWTEERETSSRRANHSHGSSNSRQQEHGISGVKLQPLESAKEEVPAFPAHEANHPSHLVTQLGPLCLDGRAPRPLGASLHHFVRMQIANGEAARMMLYDYDFKPGEAQLTRRGRVELLRIGVLAMQNPFPILIQANDSPLDEERRRVVRNELTAFDIMVPLERILVARPPTRGMDSFDATVNHMKLLRMGVRGASSGMGGDPGGAARTTVPAGQGNP
jgi:hypothetical protein